MSGLIEARSLINGSWVESERVALVSDYEGKPRMRLYGVTDTQVRIAKRCALQLREELAAVPLETLIRVVKRAGRQYFTDAQDCQSVALLSGSPITYVNDAMAHIREFLCNIELYIQSAFGAPSYERVPVIVDGNEIAYRVHVPTGPVVAVIPQNDDGVSAYVLAQLFLSKNPAIVKPSSRGGSAFSTIHFIEALHAAIDVEAPQYPCLRRALQLINVLDDDGKDRTRQVVDLAVDGATIVLFGSSETVGELQTAITAAIKPRRIVSLGTGFSVTLVMPDADLARCVEDVVGSVLEDRGNKCTTTHVLYLHEDIYDALLAELRRRTATLPDHGPLDPRAVTGCLDDETRTAVERRLLALNPHHALSARDSPFAILETDEHAPVEELPGIILFVKKVVSVEHFCELHARDRSHANVEQGLTISVYTVDDRTVQHVAMHASTHLVKWNLPTNAINLFLEHQGLFILRELLEPRLVEHAQLRLPLLRRENEVHQ